MSHAGVQPLAVIAAPGARSAPALAERLHATPRICCDALCGAINSADLEAALACFAPGACLVWEDGTTAQGQAAIQERLRELIARAAHVAIELRGVLVASDTAIAHERWQISYGDAVDANAARTPGPTLALRCLGGQWRIAIAAPWGWDPTSPLQAIGFSR